MTNRTARSKRNSPQRFLSTFHGTGGTCSRRRSCNTYLLLEGRVRNEENEDVVAGSSSVSRRVRRIWSWDREGTVESSDAGYRGRSSWRLRDPSGLAGCHGPDLAKPKGRFGYVLDLRRIASNPEMVIPQSTDRIRAVHTRPGGRDAPDRLAARSAHAGAKGSHAGMDRRWCPGRSPGALDSPPSVRSGPTTPTPIRWPRGTGSSTGWVSFTCYCSTSRLLLSWRLGSARLGRCGNEIRFRRNRFDSAYGEGLLPRSRQRGWGGYSQRPGTEWVRLNS